MPRRPPAHPTDNVDEEWIEEMLEKELQWLDLRQYHWHHDWLLWYAIHQWWRWCQSWLLPFTLLLVKLLFTSALCLPSIWLKLQLRTGWSAEALAGIWTLLLGTVVGDSRVSFICQAMGWLWITVSLVDCDPGMLIDEQMLLVSFGVDFSITTGIWLVAISVYLIGWLPPRLVTASSGWLRQGFHRFVSLVANKDASLSDLASDLEQLLQEAKPVAWDWTSLISTPENAFLNDRPPDLPLPLPSTSAMPRWWRLCHGLWGLLSSVRAWLW